MNEFQAILNVDEHIKQTNDDQLIDDWNIVKAMIHHYMWPSPPSANGVAEIEWRENARQIARTEMRGRGVLLFRMLKTLEAMTSILEAEFPETAWLAGMQPYDFAEKAGLGWPPPPATAESDGGGN